MTEEKNLHLCLRLCASIHRKWIQHLLTILVESCLSVKLKQDAKISLHLEVLKTLLLLDTCLEVKSTVDDRQRLDLAPLEVVNVCLRLVECGPSVFDLLQEASLERVRFLLLLVYHGETAQRRAELGLTDDPLAESCLNLNRLTLFIIKVGCRIIMLKFECSQLFIFLYEENHPLAVGIIFCQLAVLLRFDRYVRTINQQLLHYFQVSDLGGEMKRRPMKRGHQVHISLLTH